MAIKEIGFCSDNEETEGTEIKEGDLKVSSGIEKGVWVNEKRTPIHIPIVCRIPQKILIVMRSIEHLIISSGMGTMEFGVFLSGKFNENGMMVLTEDFYVPQQKVGGASIDFEEEPPDAKFNGVIHRHPDGCKSFSGTDGRYINSNFEFSLLYVCNDITIGICNLEINGFRLQVPLNPIIMYPIYDLDHDSVLNKIKKNEVLMKSCTTDNPLFGDRRDVRGLLREKFDDDERETLDGVCDDLLVDRIDEDEEDNELLYICKKCAEVQYIGEFPQCCEGCEEILDQDDFELVSDISELEEGIQQKVLEKMTEKE